MKSTNRPNNKKSEPPYKCEICGKIYTSQRYLTRHINSKICQREHVCDKCGEVFKNAQNLKYHKKRKYSCVPDDSDNNNAQNICQYCDKHYTRRYTLERHIKNCPMKNDTNGMMKEMINLIKQTKELVESNVKMNERFQNQQSTLNTHIEQHQNLQTNTLNNNNNMTQNNNIYVNIDTCDFGNEDLSKLDKMEVLRIIQNHDTKEFIPKMIEYLHTNPQFPEYHNIYYDEQKDKVLVFNSDQWIEMDLMGISEQLGSRFIKFISPAEGSTIINSANLLENNTDSDCQNKLLEIVVDYSNKTIDMNELAEMNRVVLSRVLLSPNFKEKIRMITN